MKIIYEAIDISVGKRYIAKESGETVMVGYYPDGVGSTRYTIVSMTSGKVCSPMTKEEIAEHLSIKSYIPIELF
jgi:hypothetical protein